MKVIVPIEAGVVTVMMAAVKMVVTGENDADEGGGGDGGGGYDTVAPRFFKESKIHAYFLEFDDERSGGFEPLKYMSEDKKVVLGLITTKRPQLEDKEVIIARIKEAAQYVPLDRLYLSPQCGFASCEIGNIITEEEQWAKLRLVKEIAEEVWGQE